MSLFNSNDGVKIKKLEMSLAEKANQTDLANKVDKVTGKGLSTNDYDNAEKAEVAKVKNKADTSYVDSKMTGTPKIIKATVSDLTTAYPTGSTDLALVTADGFLYQWVSNAWTKTTVQYQSTGIADGSVTAIKRTPIGDEAKFISFGGKNIDFNFVTKVITIPANTNIVWRNMKYVVSTDTSISLDASVVTFGTLYFNTLTNTFITRSGTTIASAVESEILLALFDTATNRIMCNGTYSLNGIAASTPNIFNAAITSPATVTYTLTNASQDIQVNFTGSDLRLILRAPVGATIITLTQTTFSVPSSNALVFNTTTATVVVRNWDNLQKDDVVLIACYHGKIIENHIGAVLGSGSYVNARVFDDDALYYSGTVTQTQNGTSVVVTFSGVNGTIYYKDNNGNQSLFITTMTYTVPHNYSLVLNRQTKVLEMVNTDTIIRGVHWILLTCHNGLAKKVGIRLENLYPPSAIPVTPRLPLQVYNNVVNQDGSRVGNELWMFDGGNPDHTGTANIHRLNKDTLVEIGTIPHNLGHANGVDYRNNKLVVFNGSAYPPEISLYTDPIGKSSLNLTDSNNTQIIFKEGSKQLDGDGSVCFGENDHILYYSYIFDSTHLRIYKILLGMGDNNLSDSTSDKSDKTKWGTFISGKASTDYNGTAQVIGTYDGYVGLEPSTSL
jgi:hypothetical protein